MFCELCWGCRRWLSAPPIRWERGGGHVFAGCTFSGMFIHPHPPTVHGIQRQNVFFLSCASKTSVSHHDGSGIISILLADGERPAPTQRQGRHCILFVHPLFFFLHITPFDLFCWWMDSFVCIWNFPSVCGAQWNRIQVFRDGFFVFLFKDEMIEIPCSMLLLYACKGERTFWHKKTSTNLGDYFFFY